MTPECERLGLGVRQITDEHDVETLRCIRNATKDGFSHDNHTISQTEQQEWWGRMKTKVRGWLYIHGTETVGYGLLRQTEDGKWWSSVAVLEQFAGHGFGGAITADLVRRHPEYVYATARLDNPAALAIHRKVDWNETHRDDRLAHYRTRLHCHAAAEAAQWNAMVNA